MYAMSASLALRSLFKTLTAREALPGRPPGLHGLTVQAKALAVAAAAHEQPGAPVVLVVPADAELDAVVGDVRFFLGALEAASDAAMAGAVLPLPSLQVDPYRALAPHMRVTSARARALLALASGQARVVVASATALLPRLPDPSALVARSLGVRTGGEVDPQSLAALLTDGGYDRHDPVEQHGEFCLRGGILDVYPPNELWPIRVEFIGDMVESIRRFDPDTQRSVETLDQFMVVPVRESTDPSDLPVDLQRAATVFDYLATRTSARLFVSEPDEVTVAIEKTLTQLDVSYEEARTRTNAPAGLMPPHALFASAADLATRLARGAVLSSLDLAEGSGLAHVPTQPIAHFGGRIPDWIAEVRERRTAGETIVFIAHTSGRAERTLEMLRDYEIRAELASRTSELSSGAVLVAVGGLSHGVRFSRAGLTVYAETDLFDDDRQRGSQGRKRSATAAFLSDLRDLKVGDLIVHVDNGIGEFVGLKQIGVGDGAHEFLELRYHGDDKLFVPVERLDLIQKYTGGSRPALDRLGGTTWAKAKTKVKKAMRDMAEELLKLYAARKAVPGHAFSPDTHWQEEFEGAFPYDLTVDQANAVTDIKRDMESSMPMDRLLCGDVGYGKTELAIRAAFKAVEYGKQAAVLVPTTILAEQHERTFRSRFADYPFRVESLSRFKSTKESNEILAATRKGQVDILIGTHRLLSKDVRFADLGLVIVDEEQRFGVEHKNALLALRMTADVLTLSATPIPRTLHMAMLGLRDISSLSTAPMDRRAVVTEVCPFNEKRIKQAIERELAREGQVFFVHNRVHNIQSMADDIHKLVPDAKILIGHGQMGDEELERVMRAFINKEADILVSTTIVESGIDIPTANTMIINMADRFGLAELHQLRGRVGRWKHRAYCYLLLPPDRPPTDIAARRLRAIEEYSMLGAGFKIAMRDLEIRGAGNLLGAEQSGHIAAVGYDMYCRLLETATHELKAEKPVEPSETTVEIGVSGVLPKVYIPNDSRRLEAYRRVALARSFDELNACHRALVDAYGPVPPAASRLIEIAALRIGARGLGVRSIRVHEQDVIIRCESPGPVVKALEGIKGTVRPIAPRAGEDRSSTPLHEVYVRPPASFLDPDSLLLVLRRRFAGGYSM